MSYRWHRIVYFARRADGTGPIKIGCSSCPSSRVKQLSFDCSVELEVIALAEGNMDTERVLHRRFAATRADGPKRTDRQTPIPGSTEWFEPTAELLSLIDEINAGAVKLPATDDRTEAIIRRYRAGETLEMIGSSLGITRERVRQILASRGIKRRTGTEASLLRRIARLRRIDTQWARECAAQLEQAA